MASKSSWGEYERNQWYSADAQIVMGICADCLHSLRRLPTLSELRAVSKLQDYDLRQACDNLLQMGWKSYAAIANAIPYDVQPGLTRDRATPTRSDRRRVQPLIREIVFAKSDGSCWYCGTEIGDDFHVDHVKPIALGGRNYLSNMVPSCQSCNCRKSTSPLEVFRFVLWGKHRPFWFETEGLSP